MNEELEQLQKKIEELEQKVKEAQYSERVVEALKKEQDKEQVAEHKTQPAENPEDIKKLLQEALLELENKRKEEEARIRKQELLKQNVGEGYEDVISKLEEKSGLSRATIEEMALNQPQVLKSLAETNGIELENKPPATPPETKVNTSIKPSDNTPEKLVGLVEDTKKNLLAMSLEDITRLYELYDKGLNKVLGKPRSPKARFFPEDFQAA